MGNKVYEDLNEFLECAGETFADNNQLTIVCNSKKFTETAGNYDEFNINTEFLSDEEVAELCEMAYNVGLPFSIFYDERNFIKSALNLNRSELNRIIVYNSAQNGIGPGRKALIPGFCSLMGISYCGSDSYRVSVCRDKFAVNTMLTAQDFPVPESFLFYAGRDIVLPSGRYLAKPLYESASIGISSRNVFDSVSIPYNYLCELSDKLRQPLLLQRFVEGYEIEVPVLIHKGHCFCFEPVCLSKNKNECYMGSQILDYDEIYNDNYFFGSLPKSINTAEIKDRAAKCAQFLSLNGLCRIDFRLTNQNKAYITDVSTNPHFVKHSSVHYAFKNLGFTEKDIFGTILKLHN